MVIIWQIIICFMYFNLLNSAYEAQLLPNMVISLRVTWFCMYHDPWTPAWEHFLWHLPGALIQNGKKSNFLKFLSSTATTRKKNWTLSGCREHSKEACNREFFHLDLFWWSKGMLKLKLKMHQVKVSPTIRHPGNKPLPVKSAGYRIFCTSVRAYLQFLNLR